MTSEIKHVNSRAAKACLQTFIYTNKKLAFFVSLLVVSLVHFASNNKPSSLYVSKRHGLGADAASGELRSALKRKGDGRAAVAIIRVIGMNSDKNNPYSDLRLDVKYLMQVKSHDYPIESFRGAVCLLGGNANNHDETPLDTLKRELNEELQYPNWINAISQSSVISNSETERPNKALYNSSVSPLTPGTVRYLGTTLHFQSADLLKKPAPYAFMCALYEITLRPDQLPPSAIYPRGANIQEGRVVLLSEDQLIRHSKYAWGYEYTMERYFGKRTVNKQKGTAVSNVDDNTLKETIWTPYKM